MTTAIDQKAYLQKYLTGRSGDKKKKKKKPIKGKGFKIIDDDIDLSKMRPLDGDELDILNEGEDAPQIAGIIDERPEELRKLEDFQTSSKWRVINQDDGFNSKLQIEEVKRSNKEIEKENEVVFGKMYSDSEDEKKDSDASPPRKNSEQNQVKKTIKSKKHNNDSDFSPPQRKDREYNSDASPPRNRRQNDASPSRKNKKSSKNYDSDESPPRRNKKSDKNHSDVSPPRKRKDKTNYVSDASPLRKESKKSNKNDDSDVSPPRKRDKSNYDSDQSPPRKHKRNYDSDQSPPRKHKRNYDSDQSPPRKHKRNHNSDQSPRKHESRSKTRRKKPSRWGDADESQLYQSRPSKSPEKFSKSKNRSPDRNKTSPKRKSRHSPKRNSDSDMSPPRKKSNYNESNKRKESKKSENNSDSDLSPPRKDSRHKERNDSYKRMEKTLDGKKAGLQDAKQLKDENQAFRRREDEAFRNMTDEMSGRNAQVVSRKGKRETSEDRQKQKEKADRQKELDEKYKKWSKGIKQMEAQQAAVQDFIHESSKPLARYRGDRDLEDKLKDIERDGDPMLQYIRERKRERGELGPEKPSYKGNFPPNRFNIRPGYRWDGVDRSNGYEKKYFEQQSKRKAQEEEAYKWSTEDL